ncbi:DNA polymerase III subunit delta, partial [Desulfurivibrio sp. C05AmB]
MPLFKRGDLPQLTAAIAAGDIAPIYLVIGERFLRREAAAALEAALLPEEAVRRARLSVIDGEHENPLQTLTRLRTYSLFGGRQVIKVLDSRLLFSRNVTGNLWEKAEKARAAGEKEEAARLLRTMLGLAGLAPAAWQSDNLAELADPQWRKLFGFSKPTD